MRRQSLLSSCLAVLALSACQHRQLPPSSADNPALSAAAVLPGAAVAQHLVDSVAARMTVLELRRVSLHATGAVQTPAVRDLEAEVASLRSRIAQMPASLDAAEQVRQRVGAAVGARRAGLVLERDRLLLHFTVESPQVQQIDREMQLLDELWNHLYSADERRAGVR